MTQTPHGADPGPTPRVPVLDDPPGPVPETPPETLPGTLLDRAPGNPPYEPAFMDRAIELAREGAAAGRGGPFGAVVVRDGEVVGEGCNQVLSDLDPTAHAEVTAIRRACTALGSFQLDGCQIYSSCEPCPMCLGAVYWARPHVLYFAGDRADAASGDFDDAFIYDELGMDPDRRSIPFRKVEHPQARQLFVDWKGKTDRTPY